MLITIHAGMHKTGTTSVQNWLKQERQVLQRADIAIKLQWRALNVRNPKHFAPQEVQAELAALEKRGIRQVIISDETISVFSPDQFAQLAGVLAPYPVELVLVFRHWSGYLRSRWGQNVKRRDAMSFGAYLDRGRGLESRFDQILENAGHLKPVHLKLISFDNARSGAGVLPTVLGVLGQHHKGAPLAKTNEGWDMHTLDRHRMFNAAFSECLGLPPDDMSAAFTAYRPVDRFLDLRHASVERHCALASETAARLAATLAEARRTFELGRDDFYVEEKRFEAAAIPHLANPQNGAFFDDVPPQKAVASMLDYADLPSALRLWLLDCAKADLRKAKI